MARVAPRARLRAADASAVADHEDAAERLGARACAHMPSALRVHVSQSTRAGRRRARQRARLRACAMTDLILLLLLLAGVRELKRRPRAARLLRLHRTRLSRRCLLARIRELEGRPPAAARRSAVRARARRRHRRTGWSRRRRVFPKAHLRPSGRLPGQCRSCYWKPRLLRCRNALCCDTMHRIGQCRPVR